MAKFNKLSHYKNNFNTYLLLIFILPLFFTACATRPTIDTVNKFAASLNTASNSVKQGFAQVQSITIKEDIEANASFYLTNQTFSLEPKKPWPTHEILQPRIMILQGLSDYAQLLNTLTGGEQLAKFDQNAKALGEALSSLNLRAAGFNDGRQLVPPAQMSAAQESVQGLGRFLIEQKLNKEIPTIIEEMHPIVETVAKLIIQDIGSPIDKKVKKEGEENIPAHGMRLQLFEKLKDIKMAKTLILEALRKDRKEEKINKLTLYHEFQKAAEDIQKIYLTDQALASIQDTLKKMVKAHAKLKTPEDPSTFSQVEIFSYQVIQLVEDFSKILK